MVIWRRWIFPILMVIIFGAASAALVKIAFFPDDTTSITVPGGQITDPLVPVERGDIVDELSLDGTVARDAAVTVRSEIDGTVTTVHVAEGQAVSAGQALFTIRQSYPVRDIQVNAPEAGEISQLSVIKGQPTSIGGELAALTPNRYHVLSTVDPALLYRLIDAPSEAEVSIPGGPAPFTCVGLRVQVAEDGTTSVRCAVPGDQTVFAGLRGTVDIRIGAVEGALVVPTTAVKGGAGTGLVWVETDGALEEREVSLGLGDGILVEVREGLEEGEQVRQFVPGLAAPDEPICYDDGMGGQYCEDPGWNW